MSKHDFPESIQAARLRLANQRPYLAALLYRLTPVATPGLKTLGVDKYGRLYFDPEDNWTLEQYTTVLYHECSHLLRDHAGRSESLGIEQHNRMAWNVAGDLEINDDLEAEGMKDWPFPPCTPKSMGLKDGEFAEEYYDKLPKVKLNAMGKGKQGPGAGKCGGCSGNPQAHEEGPPANAGGGKDATPGFSPAEAEAIRNKVANDVREHQKTQGNVPGHLLEWAEAFLNPKVDWRKVLRSAIRHAMADIAGQLNFSYQRPSRRTLPKIVLPSMRQPVPNIAVVVDTSGSMSNDDLAMVLGEVNSVLKQCGQKQGVDAIVCDAAVHSAKRVFKADQITLAGGGGTDMRIGVEAALKRPVKPHAVIILTDGFTPWPEEPLHNIRVIAALIGTNRVKAETVPTWIRTVEVE